MAKTPNRARSGDSIDHFLRQWRKARPDLEPGSFGVFGRIHRISGHFMRQTVQLLAGLGLGWESFSLIVTLRRSGPPFALRPTDLLHESLLSSGAITNRIDRVERLGLVRRTADPRDRRVVVVTLTPAGRALADRAIKWHFEAMTAMLSSLASKEKHDLVSLLGKLLVSMEQSPREESGVRSRRSAVARPQKAFGGGKVARPRAGRPDYRAAVSRNSNRRIGA